MTTGKRRADVSTARLNGTLSEITPLEEALRASAGAFTSAVSGETGLELERRLERRQQRRASGDPASNPCSPELTARLLKKSPKVRKCSSHC